jgi:hypothetical protein
VCVVTPMSFVHAKALATHFSHGDGSCESAARVPSTMVKWRVVVVQQLTPRKIENGSKALTDMTEHYHPDELLVAVTTSWVARIPDR